MGGGLQIIWKNLHTWKRTRGRWVGIEADRVMRHALKVNSVYFTVYPEPVLLELQLVNIYSPALHIQFFTLILKNDLGPP